MAAIDDIETELLANLDFEATRSASKAKLVITAANKWLVLQPMEQEDQHNRIKFNNAQVQAILQRAREVLAAYDTATSNSRVRFFSCERLRN